ncbi:MAG: N-acetyltransferase [Planctomycetes bacterium]|nr:N-acetyltransferase [Planctomycetota bacterium]MBI3834659.1 N-acetyltransferase [Planctomycetota bacterium]
MNSASIDSKPFVHPSAICECESVGEGTRIWAFAHVMCGSVIGRDCNVGDHAFIESGARVGDRVTIKNGVAIWNGVTLEDDVFVGPLAVFTNDRHPRSPRSLHARDRYAHVENWLSPTTVKQGASIGAGAVILCGITIGRFAMIAAGAVVTRDVSDHALMLDNPARQHGWACVCGKALKILACESCNRRYAECASGLKLIN